MQEGLDLGGEDQALPVGVVVERLLPRAVPPQDQAAVGLVPEREGEHPAQPLHELEAEFLVRVDDGLRVRPGREGMPARLELSRQLEEVVDLAVEDHGDGAGLVVDRLVARGEVDNAQPPVSQSHARPDVRAVGVRPAVAQDIRHATEELPVHGVARVGEREAGDSAHG